MTRPPRRLGPVDRTAVQLAADAVMFAPMFALLTQLLNPSNPLLWLFALFAVWMLVDAFRRGEYLWAFFIFIFPFLNAVLYFFLVFRQTAPAMRGFELPGAFDRRRIKELQDRIHHLDKAHHHLELADIYFQQGKLEEAEQSYRAAFERDAVDPDIQAHYGHCLLRKRREAEALPLLEQVCATDPTHEYGHTMMALAETYAALGRSEDAVAAWRRVLEHNTYARARVQLAELYAQRGDVEPARKALQEVIADDTHAPEFQRRKDRIWVRRARALLRQLSSPEAKSP